MFRSLPPSGAGALVAHGPPFPTSVTKTSDTPVAFTVDVVQTPPLAQQALREERGATHRDSDASIDLARVFTTVASIAFVVFDLIALSAFIVRDLVERAAPRAGATVPVVVANLAGFGDFKYGIVRVAALCCAVVTGVAFLVAMRAPGLRGRIGVLAIVLMLYLGTLAAIRGTSSNRFREIDLMELSAPVVPPIGPDDAVRSRLETFADLYQVVADGWRADSARLATVWPRVTPAERQALYFMAAVSHIWPSGQVDPTLPGCAVDYGRSIGRSTESMRDLLAAPYACCADFAAVLAALLRRSGVDSRIAILGGHQLVEARLNGAWHALDANSNTFVDGAWNDVIARPSGMHVTVATLPRPFLAPHAAQAYRPATGEVRWLVLSWIAERRNPVVEYTPIPAFMTDAPNHASTH